jgi:hypothetical protein
VPLQGTKERAKGVEHRERGRKKEKARIKKERGA